ncbi:MAG: DUF2145 domain-containing protein [Burkholderiaceae bacterium]|jgi:hypothetical protein
MRRACSLALAVGLLTVSMAAQAFSFEVCDRPKDPSADQRDVMLRFGALVRAELAASAQDVVLIARSGLDLHKLDVRYSHEGVALRDNDGKPWAVRELYYSCEDHKPRVFDEGMSGFLMGTDDPDNSYISLVYLPPDQAGPLRTAAVDKRHALGVLGASYSANAYPFSTRHQNCNQWVMELLADAWGAGTRDADTDADTRTRAQRWMRAQAYLPTVFTASAHPMTWLPNFVPWLANDDHPPEEVAHNRYNVSMPASIETFVQARVPGATRVELCHAGRHVVVHRGWDDIAEGCVAGPGDRTLELTPEQD